MGVGVAYLACFRALSMVALRPIEWNPMVGSSDTSDQSILQRNSRYGVLGMEAVSMARDSFKFSDHPLLTI